MSAPNIDIVNLAAGATRLESEEARRRWWAAAREHVEKAAPELLRRGWVEQAAGSWHWTKEIRIKVKDRVPTRAGVIPEEVVRLKAEISPMKPQQHMHDAARPFEFYMRVNGWSFTRDDELDNRPSYGPDGAGGDLLALADVADAELPRLEAVVRLQGHL